jgi:hypothetical protein
MLKSPKLSPSHCTIGIVGNPFVKRGVKGGFRLFRFMVWELLNIPSFCLTKFNKMKTKILANWNELFPKQKIEKNLPNFLLKRKMIVT